MCYDVDMLPSLLEEAILNYCKEDCNVFCVHNPDLIFWLKFFHFHRLVFWCRRCVYMWKVQRPFRYIFFRAICNVQGRRGERVRREKRELLYFVCQWGDCWFGYPYTVRTVCALRFDGLAVRLNSCQCSRDESVEKKLKEYIQCIWKKRE